MQLQQTLFQSGRLPFAGMSGRRNKRICPPALAICMQTCSWAENVRFCCKVTPGVNSVVCPAARTALCQALGCYCVAGRLRGGAKRGLQPYATAGRLKGRERHQLVLVFLSDKFCAQAPSRNVLQVS